MPNFMALTQHEKKEQKRNSLQSTHFHTNTNGRQAIQLNEVLLKVLTVLSVECSVILKSSTTCIRNVISISAKAQKCQPSKIIQGQFVCNHIHMYYRI